MVPKTEPVMNPLSAFLPLLTADFKAPPPKSARVLVAKGLPTLPAKVVEKAQSLEFVEMEEFLPAPRALHLAEHEKPSPSFQESLVGALNQFQAAQQQKAQRRVMDITTWTRCFTLYIAVVAKVKAEMVPAMVAHLHTVYKLHGRAPHSSAWLEYDLQFRMEAATSEEKKWEGGDPWQFVSCLPGQGIASDPFVEILTKDKVQTLSGPSPFPVSQGGKSTTPFGKGKGPVNSGPPSKKAKKLGVCRYFNSAPGGCLYGSGCTFTHRCSNCGAVESHHTAACPTPSKTLSEAALKDRP